MRFAALFTVAALFSPVSALAAELVASPWVDLREARIRIVLETQPADVPVLRGALEIRMVDGYKTYWRHAGDSGVPPSFDFSKTPWLGKVDIRFPFPGRFDDGAGGTAFGYVGQALLPFEVERVSRASGPLHLKLDFAICGTMCIPMSGEIAVDPARAARAGSEMREALENARNRVPLMLPLEAARAAFTITREAERDGKPRWSATIRGDFDPQSFQVFPEGRTFLQPGKSKLQSDGILRVTLTGEPPPGFTGQFGTARLTFGDAKRAFEVMIDLDASAVTP